MKAVKITIEYNDGGTWATENEQDIRNIGLGIPHNIKWRKSAGVDVLRNKYFQMLSELAKNANTGDTKVDLHNNMKTLIFSKLYDFPQYFSTGFPEYSTRNLSREGWVAVIEQLKSVANDVFGYIFK